MFTGIVEETGEVVDVQTFADASRLTIRRGVTGVDARPGDSVAVNGVCLTVVDPTPETFCADVMAETLRRSSLGALTVGDRVNLERPLAFNGRLGGHLVQGHVDGMGTVQRREPSEHWTVLRISAPAGIAKYLVEKGSIAVDGVSLTVSGLGDDWFEVSLIPTTLSETTLGARAVGDVVNLEADMIAKHVERLMEMR